MIALIVEDSRDLAQSVQDFLVARGWSTVVVDDGEQGLAKILAAPYDVAIVDVMLPGKIDGYELCRRVRRSKRSALPLLMLTACVELDDKLAGFEAGADDYLTKPFSLHELYARVRALVGRRDRHASVLELGPVVLDLGQQRVIRDGVELSVSESGIKLLTVLMQQSPNVVDRQRLGRVLWPHTPPDSDALKTHIYYLRRELDRRFETPLIHTVRGRGYRFVVP